MVSGKLDQQQTRIREWQTGVRMPATRWTRIRRRVKYTLRRHQRSFNVSGLGCLLVVLLACGMFGLPLIAIARDSHEYSALVSLVDQIVPTSTPAPTGSNNGAAVQYIPPVPSTSLSELAVVGLVSAVIFPIIGLLLWYAFFGPKHVVYAFTPVREEEKDPVLQALAAQATQMFVKRIQEIGALLGESQAEDMNSRIDNTLSLYVADGTDASYVEQIRSLSSIEAGSFRFPIGTLIMLAQRYLSKTRVRGTVYRLGANRVEIDVHYTRSVGGSFSVGSILVAQDAPDYYSEAAMHAAIDQLAVSLVHRIGDARVVASSEEALSFFLASRQASVQRNWWHAIAMFRNVTRLEEAQRGLFGRGHFHLGAALAMQGEYAEALNHFVISEQSGPPIAEALYMHALCLYHINQNDLDKASALSVDESTTSNKIIHLCEQALILKPQFAEARHLMGATYYQMGKLAERKHTQRYDANVSDEKTDASTANATQTHRPVPLMQTSTGAYKNNYESAAQNFLSASTLYASRLDELFEDDQALKFGHRNRDRLFKQWLSVTHQRASAMRSLRDYSTAYVLYQNVHWAMPNDIRNNCGILRNECLSSKPKEALVAWSQILDEYAYGHADLNLYYGWALAQQAHTMVHQLWKPAIQRMAENGGNLGDPCWCLHRAFRYLDYAIHERPRFVTRWYQTDWLQPLLMAAQTLQSKTVEDLFGTVDHAKRKEIYKSRLVNSRQLENSHPFDANDGSRMIEQNLLWLAWRMDSLHFTAQHVTKGKTDRDIAFPTITGAQRKSNASDKIASNTNDTKEEKVKTPASMIVGIDDIYDRLRQLRLCMSDYLKKLDATQIADSLANRWAWSLIAEDAYKLWVDCSACIVITQSSDESDKASAKKRLFDNSILKELGRKHFNKEVNDDKSNHVTFAERWLVDLFAEISLAACRTLAECHAYETLNGVAAEASALIDDWLEQHWHTTNKKHGEAGSAKFTQKVMRLQMSSLLAWKAFACLQMRTDLATKARLQLSQKNSTPKTRESATVTDETAVFESIQSDITEALRRHPNHPVAVIAQAILHEQREAIPEAIEELNRLLLILAPMEPDLHTTAWERRLQKRGRPEDTDKARSDLYYMARVCGQEQFEGVVHPSRVHNKLADLLARIGDHESRTEHLLLALAKSPFKDLDNLYLFNLAEALIAQDRFSEALSVINEMRVGFDQLVEIKHYARSSRQLDVLQGKVESRLGHAQEALRATKTIASDGNRESKTLLDRFMKPNPKSAIQRSEILARSQASLEWADSFKAIAQAFIESVVPNNTGNSSGRADAAQPSPTATQKLLAISKYHAAPALALELDKRNQNAKQQTPASDNPSPDTQVKQDSNVQSRRFDRALLEASQVIAFVTEEAILALVQICDASNTYVYNLAQLRMDEPMISSPISLVDSSDKQHGSQQVMAITKEMIDTMTELSQTLGDEARVLLAQYFDTKGWSEFMQADSLKKLEQARETLLLSINTYPGLAISNYHLARVYFREFQFLWQEELEGSKFESTILIKMMSTMREARHHWNEASTLDRNARLTTALSRLSRWMDQYTARWDEMQFGASRALPPEQIKSSK